MDESKAIQPAPPPRPKPAPRRPTAASDWSRLAAELGIEVPEEPAPAVAPPEPSRETEMAERRPRAAEAAEPEAAESEETLTGLAEKLAEAVAPEEETSGERRPGRRRRKRRRRVSKPLGEVEMSAAEEAVEMAEEGEAAAEELTEVEAETEAGAISARPEEEAPGARPKRRRRRRGGKRRENGRREGEREGESAPPGEPLAAKAAAEPEEPAGEEGEDSDEFLQHEAIHRGIPTWQEAIGYVVTANMESRAKRPGGPPRSRGGGRGGRDRSSDKSN